MSKRTSHGLFVVDAEGGRAAKVLSGCVVAFAWSPDGSALAVERVRRNGFETVLVDVVRKKTRVLARDGSLEAPTWSPDGRRIAFVANYSGIRVSTLDGVG